MSVKQKNSDKITDKRLKNLKPAWKEGESGNPNGRPLGTKNFNTDFDEAVKEIAEEKKITTSEARKILIKKAFTEAEKGNFPFYKDICDRYYGKAQENLDLTSGGEKLSINFDPIFECNSTKNNEK
jgi:hypothetical protein